METAKIVLRIHVHRLLNRAGKNVVFFYKNRFLNVLPYKLNA